MCWHFSEIGRVHKRTAIYGSINIDRGMTVAWRIVRRVSARSKVSGLMLALTMMGCRARKRWWMERRAFHNAHEERWRRNRDLTKTENCCGHFHPRTPSPLPPSKRNKSTFGSHCYLNPNKYHLDPRK